MSASSVSKSASKSASSVSSSSQTPSLDYLKHVRARLAAVRKDLPQLQRMGQRMSAPILAGGNVFCPMVAKYWFYETIGRAGGMMGLKNERYTAGGAKGDVAFLALPNPQRWNPQEDETLKELMNGPAELFVVGRPEELGSLAKSKRFSGFTGGAVADDGLYGVEGFQPLCTFREMEQLLRGWVTMGEMITAFIRAGKMPIIWMSIWLEGAQVRNAQYSPNDNIREVWYPPLFHKDRYITPIPAGHVANEFLAEFERIVGVLESQSRELAKAGQWMAQAAKAGKKVHAVAVGHSYPNILQLPEKSAYPITWGKTNSNLATAVPKEFGNGDVAIHFGYAPVDVADVGRILDRGLKFIYTSPYGRPATLKNHKNLLWLDLPWRPADATVDIPGYSVRILPMSSSVQTAAYFAMLAEMAKRMGWERKKAT